MSSNTVNNQDAAVGPTRSQFVFWNDDTVDLNDKRLKKNIPPLPRIEGSFQTVRGSGIETLAFLALQVQKSNDKGVIIRAIASACSVLLEDDTNYTGSRTKVDILTGLEPAAQDGLALDTILTTNFIDEEPVTIGELLNMMDADVDEMGALFGVYFLAGTKRIDAKNKTAFNERRKSAATASIIGEPKIFVDSSPALADEVMEKIYATFLSRQPLRSNMISIVIGRLDRAHMGPALAFTTMFLLLVDSGLSALRIIKEAVLKYPEIRTRFPELKPEFHAANAAQIILRSAPARERSFVKAIHGSNFVPVNYSDIDNLLGVCKEVMKRTVPSYQNYGGGKITEAQAAIIGEMLGNENSLVETVAAD